MKSISLIRQRKGIKIYCLECRKQVSSFCKKTKTILTSCNHNSRHKFQLVVHVPKTKNGRRMRFSDAKNFEDALVDMKLFKDELLKDNYVKPFQIEEFSDKKSSNFLELVGSYLDSLNGINVPRQFLKVRSKQHIADVKRAIERFAFSLKEKNYDISRLTIQNIKDKEVGYYCDYLLKDMAEENRTYFKSIGIMKAFVNWTIDMKEIISFNAFAKIEIENSESNAVTITKDEFIRLLDNLNSENGFDDDNKRNWYYPWLKFAFRLSIETPMRREELVSLKWSDLKSLEDSDSNNGKVFVINNIKVNRSKKGKSAGKYKKYIPVTESLLELLIELNYEEKIGSCEFVIPRDENISINYMRDILSRAFNVFIKFASERDLEFNCLRKTYITKITMKLGDKAKMFTGHSDDAIIRKNYLNKEFSGSSLDKFRIF
jgi:integrase